MIKQAGQIKDALEKIFDIPFFVTGGIQNGEPWFAIGPENASQELFRLSVFFKNATRVIIDFEPEKYAAPLIMDMAKASLEQKLLFKEYSDMLQIQKLARVDLFINKIKYEPSCPASWPAEWTGLSCRITRSPVTSDDEKFDLVDLTIEWVSNALGMFLSLMHIVPIDNDIPEKTTGYTEGKEYITTSKRYERNPLNRQLCVASKGYICAICGFDFSSTYRDIGNGFIEVHHIEPLSMMEDERAIDPIKDLIPVCSNCHSMIHRRKPPLLPDELQEMMIRS
ncbi:MAG TPA: HNH endonuclease [Negativicutes bacterium]|nr:HNH endonuclease [Clostridia bacterium]HWR29005.1 HNH endonuclease [Negativicutes bacterium]